MVKKFLALILALSLFAAPALCELTVERTEGERFFPDEKAWVYHFTYAYPHIVGEDYTCALINDTYQMAFDELTQLVLPMFANAEDMRFDGRNEVTHDYSVMCNNGRVLSVLERRSQTMGEEGIRYTLEALTFDVGGMYAGETLTLRGVALIQAGVDASGLEDVNAQDYPALGNLISGSSGEMGAALIPVLYQEFAHLQEEGVMDPEKTYDDFVMEFSPTRDFYTDENGDLVFFFPPALMAAPSFDAPAFSFSPERLNELLPAAEE